MQEKIAVFVLSFTSPKWASAVYENGYLTFGAVKDLPAKLSEQQAKIKPAVVKLMGSGFKVLVDEVSPIITSGTGASLVNLSAKHRDDRPVLVAGIARYRELKRLSAIVLPANTGDRFTIPDDVVESEFNAAGDEVYRINWVSLTSDHVVMILACYATIFHPVASAAYIQAMNAGATESKTRSGLLASFHRIIGKTIETANPADPEAYSGTVIDDVRVL